MNTANLSLTNRIRLAALRGIVKLLARAIAPALSPAAATASGTTQRTQGTRDGLTIDGEFRRVETRHNNNW